MGCGDYVETAISIRSWIRTQKRCLTDVTDRQEMTERDQIGSLSNVR